MNKFLEYFSWDVVLEKLINKAMNYNCNSQTEIDSMSWKAKSCKYTRTLAPIFYLDQDLIRVIKDIGKNYMKYEASTQILNFIKLPYDHLNLELTFAINLLDNENELPSQKNLHHIKLYLHAEIDSPDDTTHEIYNNDDPANTDTTLNGRKYLYFTEISLCSSPHEKIPGIITNSEIKGLFLDSYSDKSIEESCLLNITDIMNFNVNPFYSSQDILEILIGFIISLNTKQLYDTEVVPAKKSMYHNKGKPVYIKEHTYKKLTLSLKGRQHLEYIQERKSGTKNNSRLHLRRGHFKQRKTGLFWWNAHMAGKNSKFTVEKDYKVK